MSGGDRYKAMLESNWTATEATRARLQRLQELEEQRRQRMGSVQERSRSSSLDRGSSSSRELLFGSRRQLHRSSFRESGRRLAPSMSVEERSRALQRIVGGGADSCAASDDRATSGAESSESKISSDLKDSDSSVSKDIQVSDSKDTKVAHSNTTDSQHEPQNSSTTGISAAADVQSDENPAEGEITSEITKESEFVNERLNKEEVTNIKTNDDENSDSQPDSVERPIETETSVRRNSDTAANGSISEQSINSNIGDTHTAADTEQSIERDTGTAIADNQQIINNAGIDSESVKNSDKKDGKEVVNGAKGNTADTEKDASSEQWSVSTETDKKLMDMMTDKEARLQKLRELENLRSQGRAADKTEEETSMSARERFNISHTSARPARQLSLREQIRRERRARRHSDLQLSTTSTFGTESTGNTSSLSSASDETSGGGKGERTSRAINLQSWDAAFGGDRDRDERMKRMKELERMRKEGPSGSSGSFDLDRSSHGRDTYQSLTRDTYQPSFSYSSNNFPLTSSRQSESVQSLTNRRLFELPLQFSSISEQREPSFFSSAPRLNRTSSTTDVLTRARETLDNVVSSRRLTVNTDSEEVTTQQESVPPSVPQTEAGTEDSDDVPVYVEGSPQGVPYVDDEGRTHWIGPTSPKYNEVVNRSSSNNRYTAMSPHSTVMNMRDTEDDPIRARQRNRGLPPEIQDHFLAECFDPKYSLKERIVLIRKKLWGDPPQLPTSQRGKPDGASHGDSKAQPVDNTANENPDIADDENGTKTI